MAKTQTVLAGIAFVLAIAFISLAQTVATTVQPASADSIVQIAAESQGLAQVAPEDVPIIGGTFWWVMPGGNAVPAPCAPLDLSGVAIYQISEQQFLVDQTGGQVVANTSRFGMQAQATSSIVASQADAVVNLITQIQTTAANQQIRTMALAMGMDVSSQDGDSSGNGGGFSPMFSSASMIDTNALWLEITNVSDGQAYLNLHNATNLVYSVWSTTNLAMPFPDWQVEVEIWPTDTNCTPFMVLTLDRPNLFLRAEDWTGVTESENTTPDWWLWKYYHRIDLLDSDLDANGNTLLYDYTNNMAPNDVGRAPVLLSTISVTDPVDLKWDGTHLYVLSGSTATIAEFATNGSSVRSLSGIGSNPSGFDVDAAGNVYVALTGGNQVWKFNPTASSFTADTNFGFGGFIGATNGTTGTSNGQFNAPFDVAVSPDGGTISVSDSGNNRVQQFSANGTFAASFGSSGSGTGQFSAPKGLTYDAVDNLYVADSGNNRIVLANDLVVLGVSGTNGTAFGQFNAPANVCVNDRGIYVADAGNNRIQCFNPLANGVYSFSTSDFRFVLSTNFNQPAAIAAVGDLLTEKFYVADTGNSRVVLYGFASDDPTPAWNSMTNRVAAGDISGAVSSFCSDTADSYQQAFSSIGTSDLTSDLNQIGTLTPVFIRNDAAEYYFEKSIEGHTILFPVEFMKENGVWKIISF